MPSIPPCDMREHGIWLEPGTRFHSWTVIGTPICARADQRPNRYPCRCNCGQLRWILVYDLLSQRTKGCTRCRSMGQRNSNYRHGDWIPEAGEKKAYPRLYWVWAAMTRRCRNPNTKDWQNYGGRGISVCPEWLDYRTFRAWATAHGYAEGLTLERTDNDGNYEPANCRWIPQSEQSRNRRSRWRDRETGDLFTDEP